MKEHDELKKLESTRKRRATNVDNRRLKNNIAAPKASLKNLFG